MAQFGQGDTMRERLFNAMSVIQKREKQHFQMLYNGLQSISSVKIYGLLPDLPQRAPTLSFTKEGKTAEAVCKALAEKGIFAWDGNFYAIRAAEILGLMEIGGVTRMGMSIYTTKEEIERTIEVVKEI
jgi:selenocysteine lyase/cysteine desulfurase